MLHKQWKSAGEKGDREGAGIVLICKMGQHEDFSFMEKGNSGKLRSSKVIKASVSSHVQKV